MPRMKDVYNPPPELVLGKRLNVRIPEADQKRQRAEVEGIRNGRGQASRLIQVKKQIHRFLAELLWAIGEERAHDWGKDLWQNLLQNHTEAWKSIYNDSVKDERRRLADDPLPKSVIRALNRIDLAPLAEALKQTPVRLAEAMHASPND
jgi:hypothetical protein